MSSRWSVCIGAASFFAGAALSHFHHVSSRETEFESNQHRQAHLEAAFKDADGKRELLSKSIDGVTAEKNQLEQEVSALRIEIAKISSAGRAKTASDAPVYKDTPFAHHVRQLIDKAAVLDKRFAELPQRAIPELANLTAGDWLKVTESADLQSEELN